nr:Holliday junction resolvase RuvX [Sessilibacter corallicola]
MKNRRTIVAFDYGLKNLGAAVGQTITSSASELPALKARDGVPNWDEVANLLKEWKPDLVVVGNPINLDGSASELSNRAKKFSNRINGRFNIPVEMVDERYSSREAKSQAREQGHKGNYGENPIDSVAARIILETWLNEQPQS